MVNEIWVLSNVDPEYSNRMDLIFCSNLAEITGVAVAVDVPR